jgi:hypothetical protein
VAQAWSALERAALHLGAPGRNDVYGYGFLGRPAPSAPESSAPESAEPESAEPQSAEPETAAPEPEPAVTTAETTQEADA